MFEPLSALAVLGFTTGVLSFIVSTMTKMDEKAQEIRECKRRLRDFNRKLEDAYLQFRVWHAIWVGNEAFPDSTYVHFWDNEGLESVESRIHEIFELTREIQDLLRQPVSERAGHTLRHSEMRDWQKLLAHGVAALPSFREQNIGLVRKIGFTLFRNAILLEKTGQLKSHVEGLRDFTQYTFRLAQQSSPNTKVERSELRRISDLKNFFDRISNFGSLLYNTQQSNSRFEWRLELGPPEAGNTLEEWAEADAMHIDFTLRERVPDVRLNTGRVRLHVAEKRAYTVSDLLIITRRIDEVVLSGERHEYHSGYDGYFNLLDKPYRRSRPLRQMITDGLFSGKNRKAFDMDRADLVYGLGHWMVLLWNTPWSFDLCTCGIRCVYLADARARHTFFPCPNRSHWSPECHPSTLAQNRFELLGVALAEIALALPISVMVEPEKTSYIVGEEVASRKELLGKLRKEFGPNTITKAVGYCFDPYSVNSGDSLRPDHLEQYCQNIILP